MKIAVAGGTGVVGRHVVRELESGGHEPVVLARSAGIDLTTGAGLEQALSAVEAVIDVTNTMSTRRGPAAAFFRAVADKLMAAEQRSGARHHVVLSIVGIDRTPLGYYRAKLDQEEVCLAGPVPATILRATQFHEFPAQMLKRFGLGPLVVVPRMWSQTVAAREVAAALVDAALGQPAGRLPDLAGPRVERMDELVRQVVQAQGRRSLIVPLRIPGRAGTAMAEGGLLPTDDGSRGTQTFDQWLASEDARSWLERH
jgi:uncharacterized protein YbjT (DUF2867 family)